MVLWRVLLNIAMPPRWALLERVECLSSLGHSPLALINSKYLFVKAFCGRIDQRNISAYLALVGFSLPNILGGFGHPFFYLLSRNW